MSSYMSDISAYISATSASSHNQVKTSGKSSLDMTDFLMLMVTEMANQSIDSTTDTADMLNQLVQMQMVDAITNMTDASIMTYAASLVGKEVTVGQMGANNKVQEYVGIVTGTGMMNGKQVVFVDDKYYFMDEIMAVGRLPEQPKPVDPDAKPEGGEGGKPVDPGTKPEGGEGGKPVDPSTKPEGGDNAATEKPSEQKPEAKPDQVPAYDGTNGVPDAPQKPQADPSVNGGQQNNASDGVPAAPAVIG